MSSNTSVFREIALENLGDQNQPCFWAVSPRQRWYIPCKALIEWLLALALVLLTAPLMLLLALLVKLTSTGPALYAQTRLGRYGRVYRMVKLRTMVHNAEAHCGPVWAAKEDCRITPIGCFLRKTHLDELPQLWNVLRGEMGLIGPRPERPEIANRIERQFPDFPQRLRVRPGITGLAQMLLPADDPDDTTFEGVGRKLTYDLYYVDKVSLWLDLRIALSTPCYFLAHAISFVQRGLLHSYAVAVRQESLASTLREPQAVMRKPSDDLVAHSPHEPARRVVLLRRLNPHSYEPDGASERS